MSQQISTMIVYCVVLVLAISEASSYVTYGGSYRFSSTLALSDNASNPVGYQFTAIATINQINQELILADLQGIKLAYATKKLPKGTFQQSKLPLDSQKNNPFFIVISDGLVRSVYISTNDEPSIANVKKGFASLLQFQSKTSHGQETDTSGTCHVNYEVSDNSHITKTKNDCLTSKEKSLWGGKIISQRKSEINLEDGKKLLSVLYRESHILKPSLSDFDVEVTSKMDLVYEIDYAPTKSYENLNADAIIASAEKDFSCKYTAQNLKPLNTFEGNKPPKFTDIVKDNIKGLSDKEFGTKKSAVAALNVMTVAKKASYQDIYKALKAKSSKKIRGQIIDALGAVQTTDSHKAAKQFLNLTSDNYDLDLCERYLWALSISPNHEKSIIQDLLEFSQHEFSDMKLYETLVQTISSMVKKYSEDSNDNELLEKTLKVFTENLRKCKQDDELCQRIYLKSFKNIASPRVLSLILDYALNGSQRTGMRAMKALWSLGKNSWNDEVIKAAERILLTNGTYDSSAKTIAVDILLETNPSDFRLAKMLNVLRGKGNSKSTELKEYLVQRLIQTSQRNKSFEKQLKSVLSSENLNHYNTMAQGGLSTAFERRFMDNGFLSTTQEVMSGILKQGYVHINLEEDNNVQTVFTLGLFSNGLNSFVSSEEDSGESSDELNAGLELTVLGVEFRPFIFFEGNGELMGHVFSGAGSTLTPAYQAVLLLEDYVVNIPLGVGQMAEVTFSSVASADLSGKIEISIWSRTAESLVQNRAGIVKRIGARVISPLVLCEIEHDITAEPQLSLTSYVEFSGKMGMCLQLQQPESVVEYSSTKYEKIHGTKQRVKRSAILKRNIPGKSYALNSKNNEMCNIIYPSS